MNQEYKASSFISKFYSMLQNKNFERTIKFEQKQSTIFIFDKQKLEIEILPYFFRHNNFTSFIRQLNLYGFKKIKKSAVLSFTHPALLKGQKFQTIVAKKKLSRQEYDGHIRNPITQPHEVPEQQNTFRLIQMGATRPDRMPNTQLSYCPHQGYFFLPPSVECFQNQPFVYPVVNQNWSGLTYIIPMQNSYQLPNTVSQSNGQ